MLKSFSMHPEYWLKHSSWPTRPFESKHHIICRSWFKASGGTGALVALDQNGPHYWWTDSSIDFWKQVQKHTEKVGICLKNSRSREPKNPTEEDPGPARSSTVINCCVNYQLLSDPRLKESHFKWSIYTQYTRIIQRLRDMSLFLEVFSW